ncbi:MAG: hypothetical protein EPN82_01565 [Bacteroidetes bacterium]|nr:MAG: hypothetical protein EPN82_01565 [Bacteroidota bacterium]
MKATKYFIRLLILIVAIIGGGCAATYNLKNKTDLKEQEGNGPIRALTNDSLLYTLETFSFTDSHLKGRGTLKKQGLTVPFDDSIPFNHIVFIEGLQTSTWKGIWVVPMAFVLISGLPALLTPNEFGIKRFPAYDNRPHDTGTGSCPYVYAFDGKQFRLEAEAFGTSVSKSLEAQTFSLLPSLVPADCRLTVRVSNERPETHLLNSVNLFVADAPENSSVVLDINNVLWQLPNTEAPVAAIDNSGKNLLNDIMTKDNCYWKSNLTNITINTGFRDTLEFDFKLPQDASEATLFIHAINTELINEVYSYMGAVLGDATLQFYQALEHDSKLQRNIRDWISECSLKIEMLDGTTWKEAGMMPPEANVVPFSRAIRLCNLSSVKGPLRLRLSTLSDVWRLDAVSVDFSPVKPLQLQALEMNSVSASDNRDWEKAIKSNDSSYALILPLDYFDIHFNPVIALGMKNPVYVFAAQGYLYEWFPTQTESAMSVFSDTMKGVDRIAILKLLLDKQRNFFLTHIYEGWRKSNLVENGSRTN